ncbi:MAG TPA: beta-propeller fold lactonase family protein [Phycisphaerales bacterium]|nr:beta-propeller fold lactonase family protein [Phycisphaerales bacterium]
MAPEFNRTFSLQSALSLASALLISTSAFGQSAQRAVFTANNGNLEGSVTSYTFNPDNSLHFVQKFVTGSTPNSQTYNAGTNAQSISISPDGRYLCTGHGTSSTTVEQLTIIRVNPDATMSAFATFTTPDSPLDVQWITNNYLAATKTVVSGGSQVLVYRFDDAPTPTLTQIDAESTGSFSTTLALHPSGQYLYAMDSTGNSVSAFAINTAANNSGFLTLINFYFNGSTYPLGLGISPDGTRLYSAGGISSGGHAVSGWTIDTGTGVLTPMVNTPYTSPGSSPKQVVVSSDNKFAFVGHGTDSTVRSFEINQATGELTSTGFSYDVGFQGSLGEIAILDNLILMGDRDTIDDGVKGLRCFTIGSDGSMTENGTIVDTQGTVGPNALAVWKPKAVCVADIAGGKGGGGDGQVNIDDLTAIILAWGTSNPAADINDDGQVNIDDLTAVILAWGPC